MLICPPSLFIISRLPLCSWLPLWHWNGPKDYQWHINFFFTLLSSSCFSLDLVPVPHHTLLLHLLNPLWPFILLGFARLLPGKIILPSQPQFPFLSGIICLWLSPLFTCPASSYFLLPHHILSPFLFLTSCFSFLSVWGLRNGWAGIEFHKGCHLLLCYLQPWGGVSVTCSPSRWCFSAYDGNLVQTEFWTQFWQNKSWVLAKYFSSREKAICANGWWRQGGKK